MHGFLSNIVGWNFMNDPAWRWGIAVGMIMLFMIVWAGVLRHM